MPQCPQVTDSESLSPNQALAGTLGTMLEGSVDTRWQHLCAQNLEMITDAQAVDFLPTVMKTLAGKLRPHSQTSWASVVWATQQRMGRIRARNCEGGPHWTETNIPSCHTCHVKKEVDTCMLSPPYCTH